VHSTELAKTGCSTKHLIILKNCRWMLHLW